MTLLGKFFGIMFGLLLILGAAAYLLLPAISNQIVRNQMKGEWTNVSTEFESNLDTDVVRTAAGEKVHLKITVLVPRDAAPGKNEKIFLYGWRGEGKAQVSIGDCPDSPQCKFGFPITSGTFPPGSRHTVEVDLERSFVEAPDAHFYLGLGSDSSFTPSNDLLHPHRSAPPVKD